MCIAAMVMMASAVVQANQCPRGGECPSDSEPQNGVSLLQTKFQMNGTSDSGKESSQQSTEMVLAGMEGGEQTILETCPVERFSASLAWLLNQGLLQESSSTSLALSRYLEIAEQHRCARPVPGWTVSDKPLIINVGEGTTGTRSLATVMRILGYKTCHWCKEGHWDPEDIDSYDYITDKPSAFLTWELLQSHPKALFFMTMREPVDWRESRISNHKKHGPALQAVPCGISNQSIASDNALQTYVAYSAWAKCVLPADRLLVTNFFTNDQSDSEFFDMLIDFLQVHGMQKSDWDKRVADARDAYLNRAPSEWTQHESSVNF